MARPVEIVRHDPAWIVFAAREATRLRDRISSVVDIHHMGSTAIAGLHAKPIIDLIAVVTSLDALDAERAVVESLGYEWRGPYGLEGRRYCVSNDAITGRRWIHLHCYMAGHPAIRRHLAFRDLLRACPETARSYEREKHRCAMLHPGDNRAYSDCKSGWIRQIEAQAPAERS